MRALVTGASGFTGRVLCALLAREGVDVFAAARAPSTAGTFVPFTWPGDAAELVRRAEPDVVFHLAGVAHGGHAAPFYDANAVFAAALLDALRDARRPCTVVLIGSAAEYGRIDASDLPIREACPPRPYGHYGASKLAQTHLGLAAHGGDLRVVVARTFNLIGPGMPPFLAVQTFVDQLASGATVLRVGNLEASRDYVHVGTAAEAYWRLARCEAAHGRVVNVCSGTPTRMSEIVETLVALRGGAVRVEVDPARVKPVDIPVHYGDPTLLRDLTGLQPALDLRAALQEALTAASARR